MSQGQLCGLFFRAGLNPVFKGTGRNKLRWLGKKKYARKTEFGTWDPYGRCWGWKSGILMLWWSPEKKGCGQWMLKTAGKRQLGAGVQLQLKWVMTHFPWEMKQARHLSDILMHSTALPAPCLCYIRANGLPLLLHFLRWLKPMYFIQLSLGSAPVSQACSPKVVFYYFF